MAAGGAEPSEKAVPHIPHSRKILPIILEKIACEG
jgi:hypothetical protein